MKNIEKTLGDCITMIQLNLSSEDKLLLYCSRLNISEDTKLKVNEILSEDLDWSYVLEFSARQGISPLLYWNLRKISNDKNIPSEAIKDLQKMYYSNLARNILLFNELSKILTAFKKTGIDVIVLKGASLAEEIYKNIGLRPMGDIDLLIKEEDLQKAKTELAKLMYSSYACPTNVHETFQTIIASALTFIRQDGKISIDVHWDIQPPHSPYKVDVNKLWKNAKPTKIAGIETLTLAPEDLLQHLCLHVDKHIHISSKLSANPLRDYCDIAEVTSHFKTTFNWEYFLQNSKSCKIEQPIFEGLSIAKKYFGALIPENFLNELKPVKSNIGFEKIFNEAMKGNSNKKYQWNAVNYLVNMKKIDGTWKRACVLFVNIFPSKEFIMHRYSVKNKKQVYLSYIIHLGTALHFGLLLLWQLPHYLLKSTFNKWFHCKKL